MKVLFLGDVVGEAGREVVRIAVARLRQERTIDFVVANGENAAGGSGITPKITYELLRYGVDVITLGDHAWDQREIIPFMADEPRLLRPLNYPPNTPGSGSIVVQGNGKKLGVICVLGRTFMTPQTDNPFLAIRPALEAMRRETPCILVDFHSEATSEKIAFGRYLDGQVSAVLGTHTHVQTADGTILPGGTAYLTDVGFCGAHDSVIGRDAHSVIQRYVTLLPQRFGLATKGLQADGVLLTLEDSSGRATALEPIQLPI
ncbi:TIGR00282 family metallophosphoesterase [Methylacidimicrobium sp. AP8]|uniref:TIGR00282 family metallophosphoesterase n=1 Tax=Methylacidimicrobium sp. AP8 TaxID=2730359 RepID=UPI001920A053|nr:TIGR00282 family metallophosphoesterase [Methylacidimicrobium sp. AP8]